MRLEFLNKAEKKELLEELNEKFGIEKINLLLIKQGKEKVRGFSGSLSKDELMKIARDIRIETIGLYLLKKGEEGIRLSFDSTTSIFKEQINKSVIEVNKEQVENWLRGRNIEQGLEIEKENFIVLRYKDYFLGCGKLSQGRITNFVPKERRIKN